MSTLVIGPNEEVQILVAIDRARDKPIPWEALAPVAVDTETDTMMLNDFAPGADKVLDAYPPQNVMLGAYHAAISFEYQPTGLFRHLSVSSKAAGRVPGPEVMQMVCEAFGFSATLCKAMGSPTATVYSPERPVRVWVEEYSPGHMAINVVEMEPPTS
jgi:hypothetical protein